MPAALAAALLAGCADGPPVRLSTLGLARLHWDTLRVAPAFTARAAFSAARPPDSLTVAVLGPDGRALVTGYARGGGPVRVPLPDARLASGALLLVEVCGYFRGAPPACEQAGLRASPKRLSAAGHVTYPAGIDRDGGRYRIDVSAERARFGARGWEPVPTPGRLPVILRLYVAGTPDDAVEVPLRGGAGAFRLAGQAGYDRFWLRLNDRLFYGDTANVRVEVLARWPGAAPERVLTAARPVRPRSPSERRADAGGFARAAARWLARRAGGEADTATVAGWRFERIDGRYTVRMTAAWRDTLGAGVGVPGTLHVLENGEGATFERERLPDADSSASPGRVRMGRLIPLSGSRGSL